MKFERWQQIEILFYAALKRDRAEWVSFLADSGAAQDVCDEVKNLLDYHEKNTSFLEEPPLKESVSLLATRQNQLFFGQKIGSYQVLKLIGTGGMGEVYLAEDTKLKRKIALKVLSPEFVSVPNLVRRFQQEARAASALNHPNILTIYEIGQEGSVQYIAAEYVDGVTLRQTVADKETKLGDILDIALQITSALAAAHDAGIVHRDIKPQNVMRRHDGYVKVLDFGIAKLVEGQFQNGKSEVSPDTATGTILGTATYMSPEQARGLAVDHRSDIWSLGVTLYEMVTRQIPFKGQTTSDVIVSILERDPVSIAELSTAAPRELDAIIKRCLSKDVDSRYGSAQELGSDLRHLQQQLELSGEAATQLSSGANYNQKKPSQSKGGGRYHLLNLYATQVQPVGANTKKDFSRHWLQFGRLYGVLTVVLLCFLIGLVAVNYQPRLLEKSRSLFSASNLTNPFQLDKITRLTNSGNVKFANISPDGKYVAYVIQEAEQQDLWIRQIAAAPSKMILTSLGNIYKGLTFSPDSSFIYFVVHDRTKGMGMLYAISTLGGDSRKITEDVDSPITFSPDGKKFAFVRGFALPAGGRAAAIISANADGSDEKRIAVRNEPDSYSRAGLAWSPDGKIIIAATTTSSDSAHKQMQLVQIQVADGSEQPFASQQWQEIGRVSWLENGIVMTALDAQSISPQIIQISYPDGELQSITKSLNGYASVSVASETHGILAIESDRVSHIWTAPANNLSQMKRLTPGIGRYYQTSWTPDGKIIYVSEESGNQDIWTMEADGSNPKQLTRDPAMDASPKASRDGMYIVFASNRSGAFHIWRMNSDGGNPVELTNGAEDKYPEFSPDSKFVYYTTYLSGKGYVSKVPADGSSAATRVFDFPIRAKALSPDGKRMLCTFLDEQTNSKWQVGIASSNGGDIIQTLNIPTDNESQIRRWTTNSQAITYTDSLDNLNNLWSVPANAAATTPKKLTNLDSSSQILYIDWSLNGKNLVCLRGTKMSDVVYLNEKSH